MMERIWKYRIFLFLTLLGLNEVILIITLIITLFSVPILIFNIANLPIIFGLVERYIIQPMLKEIEDKEKKLKRFNVYSE